MWKRKAKKVKGESDVEEARELSELRARRHLLDANFYTPNAFYYSANNSFSRFRVDEWLGKSLEAINRTIREVSAI